MKQYSMILAQAVCLSAMLESISVKNVNEKTELSQIKEKIQEEESEEGADSSEVL